MAQILIDKTTLRPPLVCSRAAVRWILHLARRDALLALDESGAIWTPSSYDEDSRRFTFTSHGDPPDRKATLPLRLLITSRRPTAAAALLPAEPSHPAPSDTEEETAKLPRSTTYRRLGVIGAGAYGRVFKAVDARGTFWALKRSVDCASEESLLLESVWLGRLRHENILRLHDRIFERVGHEVVTSLVFPLAECTLEQRARARFSEARALQWMGELRAALRFLHAAELVHLDVKPANVMLSKGRVKLGDLGAVQRNGDKLLGIYAVTRPYRSPELLLGCERVFFAMDAWAYGVLALELAMQTQLPFGRTGVEQAAVTLSLLGVPTAEQLNAMLAPWEELAEEGALVSSESSSPTDDGSDALREHRAFREDLRVQSLSQRLFVVFERLCVYGALERLGAFEQLRFDERPRQRSRPWRD